MRSGTGRLQIFNRDTLKYFVLFFMFLSHLFSFGGICMPEDGSTPLWMLVIENLGVLAPPVFFFMIADGAHYTRDRKKYAKRLLLFAILSEIPNRVFFGEEGACTVMVTLLLGLLAIMAWESGRSRNVRVILVILCDAATVLLQSSWMIFGVLFIFFLYLWREEPGKRFIAYAVLSGVYVLIFVVALGIPMAVVTGTATLETVLPQAIILFDLFAAYFLVTKCCNGKKGRFPAFSKWFFYIFYPAHILVIGIIAQFTK